VIVPVNETDMDITAIRQTLKEIYGPVGIHWEITEEKGYYYFGENKFFEEKSGLLNSYTPAMREMNADFRDNFRKGDIDPQANYVFILKYSGSTMDRDAAGFMPRGGQFGYIFTKDFQGDAEILQTIAHELGHGKLLLKHTFDKDYGIAQGTTDNLMDYAKGKTHLAKWQWDVLADPGIAQGVFDSDEDGMKAAENPFKWLTIPRNRFGFPKEYNESFFDFLVNRGSLSFEAKAELHWRLIQVAGAIWENDGLDHVLQTITQGKMPTWQSGKNALEKLTEAQRADIQRNDANKMGAILLYEFATGQLPNQTDFIETDAFSRAINKDNKLLENAVSKFYYLMQKNNFSQEILYLNEAKEVNIDFSFSPDHTGSIKESWEKHVDAWNNNPIFFLIGGMEGKITLNEGKIVVVYRNKMGLKSLALHMTKDHDPKFPDLLKSTYQTFTYILSLDQFKKLKTK
jgi:hypothetical protein